VEAVWEEEERKEAK